MRPFGLGLVAALIVAIAAPGAALAADKEKAAKIPPEALKKGMADAPKVVSAAGLACNVSAARFLGSAPAQKGVPAKDFYEVACGEGGGYVIGAVKSGTPDIINCIEAAGTPVACMLPANANAAQALGPALAKSNVQCAVEQARGIGATPEQTFLEVLCQGGTGYIVSASKPLDLAKAVKAQNCLAYDIADTQLKCTLGTKEARLAIVDQYATTAKVPCPIEKRRYIGSFTTGGEGYEVACAGNKGYVLKVDAKGAVTSQECASSPGLCELVDARQLMTEQAALYTRLAKAAGSDCEVESYAMFPSQPGKEVTELTCKSGKEMVGIFPVGGKGQVLDCARAIIESYKCGSGKTNFDSLTADLRKLGKMECVVADAKGLGKSSNGNSQLEVSCTDGKPGYVVQYSNPTTPVDALGCRLTACTMPGNKS